jgi:hypothetical protein
LRCSDDSVTPNDSVTYRTIICRTQHCQLGVSNLIIISRKIKVLCMLIFTMVAVVNNGPGKSPGQCPSCACIAEK